ncbi:MAG: zinc ribbon domain-containing protein [Sphingomonadaceae bacterium]
MFKVLRVPEKLFSVIMWIVSLIFAGFLMGLGQLVISDLPLATQPVEISQFIDPAALEKVRTDRTALEQKRAALTPRSDAADLKTTAARAEYDAAKQQYDNWIGTRQATTDPAQDPEVITRTRQLDALSASVRDAEKVSEGINAERLAIDNALSAVDARRSGLEDGARGEFETAMFRSELFVFGLRLLVTLPLLVLAGWFVLKQRKSEYWPLMRGFVIFAVYAFFFELVPYLPSWGGYVQTVVGIVLTLVGSHYAIRWMRHYLATRAVVEQQAEVERKQSIRYEDALKKMSSGVCPGCERAVATTGDILADFCVHCGMNLFDHCARCESRKLSFFRYCMKCGTAAAGNANVKPAEATG